MLDLSRWRQSAFLLAALCLAGMGAALAADAKPRIETKARRVGGATYQVPLEVPADRQLALATRWLVDLADGRKGTPLEKALASEIMEAYQGQGSAIRKRDEVHKMAQANKAFAHFRW